MVVRSLSHFTVGLSLLALMGSASFNYSDPGRWSVDYPTCGGTSQSPLSIETPSVREVSGFPFELGSDCTIPMGRTYYLEYTDGGIVVLWNHSTCILTQPNGVILQLGRIAFHTRGEHVIDGTYTALEMHLQFYSLTEPLTSITTNTTPLAILAAGFSVESSTSEGGDLEALVRGVFDGVLPGIVNTTTTSNTSSSNSTSSNATLSNTTSAGTTSSGTTTSGTTTSGTTTSGTTTSGTTSSDTTSSGTTNSGTTSSGTATSGTTTSGTTNSGTTSSGTTSSNVSSRMFQEQDVAFVSIVVRTSTATINLTVLSHTPYYHYVGSITAPPCTEGVRWYVLATSYKASRLSVEAYSAALVSNGDVGGTNSRPVQGSSEGRSVLYFTGSYPTSGGVSRCVAWSAGILVTAAYFLL